ncbi:TIGR04222 domain-containing membrane protein [Saccharothrix deserti]|uniref:TIGR04222 domain-containing membrane protein n=1 Tax=Saccharothrix deserti TaxID=2593674 RepID=UPI00131B64CD|nr:TIGR04222 domain-containing membrane protein [Saccharothrix deserti]
MGSTPEPWHAGHGQAGLGQHGLGRHGSGQNGSGQNALGQNALEPEEQAFLAGGPGRAAEVAVVALLDAGALRISREGLVSGVQGHGRARTPLQACVLRSVPRSLGDLISVTADSAEAQALRQHLISRGLVVSPGRRRAVRRARQLVVAAAVGAVFAKIALDLPFAVAGGAVVGALLVSLVLGRARRPLTGAGRLAVRRLRQATVSSDRLVLVAAYGLLGRVERRYVWSVLGIEPSAAATLRRRTSGSGPDSGGCGGCSTSSSGSDSGSSDSGGSSCGGGGCGGGGGGD